MKIKLGVIFLLTCLSLEAQENDLGFSSINNPSEQIPLNTQAELGVTVVNYTDMTAIQRFQKFELGVTLPEDMRVQVENFTENRRGVKLNPYLEWELRVYAEFTNPSVAETIVIDGFYNQQFDSWMLDPLPIIPAGKSVDEFYTTLGGYTKAQTDFPFLLRFSPPVAGNWSVKVKVFAHKKTIESAVLNFQVVENQEPGYVKVGEDKRYLQLGDKTFYPIGINVLWPNTDHRNIANDDIYDGDLAKNLTNENGQYANEEYRDVYALPRVYDNFQKLLNKLADNGANYARFIMHPVSTDIEYETAGDYTQRLHMAQEMDEFLELCEKRKLYLSWNFQIQYAINGGSGKANWNGLWKGKAFGYKTLTKSENSQVFFTDETAKKYYKQRYRYLLARYGYSTNIAIFELFSEVGNDEISPEMGEIIEKWHWEMAEYIKSQYNGKIHLLAPSYAGLKIKTDDTFKSPNIEVMSTNMYPGLKCFAKNWIDHTNKEFLDQSEEHASAKDAYTVDPSQNAAGYTTFHKPFLYSEFDPQMEACDINQIEIKRAAWQLLFSGLAGSFSWASYINGNNFAKLGQMNKFISQFNLASGDWHPGSMELKDDSLWIFNQTREDKMDRVIKKADLMYLRSGDGNYAIGVLSNKTYNIKTTDGCVGELPANFAHLNEIQDVNTADEDLKLLGMNRGDYEISYYYVNELNTPFYTAHDRGTKVKLDVVIPAEADKYLVLFVVRKKKVSLAPILNTGLSVVEITKTN